MGCKSNEERTEWLFILQVIQWYKGKFSLRGSLSYLNQ